MTRLAEIEAHAAGMAELLDIVAAMRSLAGMRMQEAWRMLPGIRRYGEALTGAIGRALPLLPDGPALGWHAAGKRALILCAAEHGFVGGLNEKLLEAAGAARRDGDLLFILGSRGAVAAEERELKPFWSAPLATRCAGAHETARSLAAELYRLMSKGGIGRVELIFARAEPSESSRVERRLLLPLDLSPLKTPADRMQPPLHNLDPQPLLEKLVFEYVLGVLTETTVEAIAAENAARFAAMQAAHDNVTKTLGTLKRQASQVRQTEITTELLELISGSGALRPTEGKRRSPLRDELPN